MTYTETKPKTEFKVNEMFATPDSLDAMFDYLSGFNGNEGIIALTCAMMMHNYLVANYDLIEK